MDNDEFTFEDAMNLPGSPTNKKKPELQLSGEDGNGFFIASRGRRALERAGYPKKEIEKYWEEVLSGDYDHLLQTMFKWFDVL